MAGRPWYVQATDVAHRLFVLSIIGGSIYITGGLATTLYMNTSAKRAARASQEHQDLAHAAVESLDEKNSGSKSNTDIM
ncbi:similar to Saccharomyces cerevisiae YML129C COX14 Mitochondrial membrane protein [Geotrichum candidum]|uniref:Similar to Saccharomyces cerevisiae YML129C COX14 Mitochondrial membrane protein n=1 Tax=Geotrichum candidum TaxID=1173061 RepID=A0A0J9YHI8_GEOCN|nr:similar to Saccharomyces cerevisiae YML129C COX14 Mitochondrial membrane protein [Geotrichum candidum]